MSLSRGGTELRRGEGLREMVKKVIKKSAGKLIEKGGQILADKLKSSDSVPAQVLGSVVDVVTPSASEVISDERQTPQAPKTTDSTKENVVSSKNSVDMSAPSLKEKFEHLTQTTGEAASAQNILKRKRGRGSSGKANNTSKKRRIGSQFDFLLLNR
jgi:hypothetical protein